MYLIISGGLIIFLYIQNNAFFENKWVTIAIFIYVLIFQIILDVIAPKQKRSDDDGDN
ncbi:TPA: hypothetical protein PDB61_002895 [Staphylococcus aureus]|uniref:hypothetical protein n=1 Tax=Staphylococcus aureus TaxID=1280 RepID=UPI0022B428A7|nr:hypothetical protein [Staphylococcus aureus]MDM5498857.1 hypothetical protein [Staphylococcus aureus]HDE4604759.1 hypothetical protein [Staphylococcus aureus]HDE4604842.1 hypothetical protein [Staphylococcus aureus]HDE4604847.1 hypothetical protein [Staphylococcus aureus]